jgi:hypothetical protein
MRELGALNVTGKYHPPNCTKRLHFVREKKTFSLGGIAEKVFFEAGNCSKRGKRGKSQRPPFATIGNYTKCPFCVLVRGAGRTSENQVRR